MHTYPLYYTHTHTHTHIYTHISYKSEIPLIGMSPMSTCAH